MVSKFKVNSVPAALSFIFLGTPTLALAHAALPGATGGAPSPEIGAFVGMALAGVTLAFVRRRKARKVKLEA